MLGTQRHRIHGSRSKGALGFVEAAERETHSQAIIAPSVAGETQNLHPDSALGWEEGTDVH